MKKYLPVALFLFSALCLWVNSGTLAPYATTLYHDFIVRDPQCGYLFNLDHDHFVQTDLMIGGYPLKNWKESQLLRLVVHPILSRPFVALLGFLWGRFIFNVLICGLSVVWLFYHFRKSLGESKGLLIALTAASFPGFTYWGGLPYHYALIAPLSLVTYRELELFLASSSKDKNHLYRFGSVIMLAGLTYEIFLPVLALVLFLTLLWRRQIKEIFWVLPMVFIPSFIINLILSSFVPVLNNNSKSYGNIIKSYFELPQWDAWWVLLKNVPANFVTTFFNSSFFVMPLIFLLVIATDLIRGKKLFKAADLFYLLGFGALFAIVNLAPPYDGWQMRGDWIARLYMPIFAVFVFYFSRGWDSKKTSVANRLRQGALMTCLLGQIMIVFGGISGLDAFANRVYFNFYKHAPSALYHENLESFGRWPLGFCKNENKKGFTTR